MLKNMKGKKNMKGLQVLGRKRLRDSSEFETVQIYDRAWGS